MSKPLKVVTIVCPRCGGNGSEPDCYNGRVGHRNHAFSYAGHVEPGSICECGSCLGAGVVPAVPSAYETP